MSRLTETMYANAQSSSKGLITGEPDTPVRHTWAEVHERGRQVGGGLAAFGVGHGDAVAVLAGAPVEIAPTAQGIWMRGASLTMLHQPTPRTDLQRWAEETMAVIKMIEADAVVVSDPFMAAAPLLAEQGIRVLTIEDLLDHSPIDPVETDDDDLALLQLTSGSTGSPKAVRITHRNFVANAEAMFTSAQVDIDTDVIVCWLPLFHDMGMTGFLAVPMYFGAELVKVTPMDFLRDTLLWAKLIDKYKGTMTAAPNFAYNLFAKRLRRQATPGQFDLSSLRWALSGAEQVEPADVEDLIDAGRPLGCGLMRSSPLTGWPRRQWQCRSPTAAPEWSSIRWTPTCWPSCTGRFPRREARPGGWPRWAVCWMGWKRASSTKTAGYCRLAASASSKCAANRSRRATSR